MPRNPLVMDCGIFTTKYKDDMEIVTADSFGDDKRKVVDLRNWE